MKRRFSRCKTFNQCEKKLTCSILSLYSYISRIIDMHTNRGRACRSPFILLRGNLIQHLPQVLPTKFRLIWLSSYREKDFYKSTNQPIRKQNSLWWPCLLMDRNYISILDRGPSKFRFIWPSDFKGDDFLEIKQSETRIACGGHFC